MKYDKKYFNTYTTKEKKVYEQYRNFLSEIGISLHGQLICDIGCATGIFLEDLVAANNCYGVDISSYAIEKCRKKFPKIANHFQQINLENEELPWEKKFTLISMFDVIEHLRNFTYLKKIIEKNLTKDGYIVITTPNTNSLLRFFSQQNFTGEIDETHTMLFTPYTMDFFLKRIGLKKIALFTPYSFYFSHDAFTKHLRFGGQIVAVYQKR